VAKKCKKTRKKKVNSKRKKENRINTKKMMRPTRTARFTILRYNTINDCSAKTKKRYFFLNRR